jgi:beta-carotene 3-hydroxylase
MGPLAAAGIVLATVAATELAAAAIHRHVMHGFGWDWHRSHHAPRTGRWERNDLYALAFAAIDVGLFVASGGPSEPTWWVAVGIAAYGVLYAYVHDGLVHRRFPAGRAPARGWGARLVRAHRLHHATRARDGAVSFGFLWAPRPEVLARRLREARTCGGATAGPGRRTRAGGGEECGYGDEDGRGCDGDGGGGLASRPDTDPDRVRDAR